MADVGSIHQNPFSYIVRKSTYSVKREERTKIRTMLVCNDHTYILQLNSDSTKFIQICLSKLKK